MQDWPYAKEVFDFKLFVLRFLKKIWLVAVAMLIGAVLVGAAHYLDRAVLSGPTRYNITTTYYIEYNNYDPVTGEMFNYTNGATWKSWIVTDWFVDRAWEHALELGLVPEDYDVVKSDLKGYFTADLPSDVRIPTSTVTTPYESLTELLNDALQLTFMDFAQEQKEIDLIRITDETPLSEADKDIRILNACILGALAGAFVAGFGLAFAIIWDDSVVIPETFTYRYDVPMTGYMGKEDKELKEEVITNVEYIFRGRQNNALFVMGANVPDKQILEKLEKYDFCAVVDGTGPDASQYEQLRQAGGILLLVEAETHTGKEIEHALQQLKLQGCKVTGALLCNADIKLIRAYRYKKRQKASERADKI